MTVRRSVSGWRALARVLAILWLAGANALGQPAKPAAEQLITMDFQDVEIGVLVKFISEITGKNFILDEKVRGKVTVISPTKITIEQAYRVFQSILEVKGFTTIPAGPTTKIVPIRDAKEKGARLSTQLPGGDEFVTQLVPLAFVDASSLVSVLQPMVSKDGLISAYDPTNTILLIDSASNIERLLRIIAELDVEVPERGIEFIKLENAFAETVAATLQEILEASTEDEAGQAATSRTGRRRRRQETETAAVASSSDLSFKVIPDERTNSLIVLASGNQLRTIKSLIRELDQSLPGVSKINVYRLKYANAVEMVEVLSQLIGGGGAGLGGLGGLSSSRRTTRQEQSTSSRFGQSGSQFGQQLGRSLGQTGGQGNQLTAASASGSGGEFIGEVRVTGDPFTNSLIISAGRQDYEVLQRVIRELDIPRRQVLVEAIILEVSLDKSRALGLESQGGIPLQDGIGIGRLNLNNLNGFISNPASLSGLVVAAASNQTINVPGVGEVPAQVALFTALQSDTDVNILSAPTILTSDNQEAEILVGQNIPFIASRATDTTNLSNTFATVERQDVGITLRLTPQVSEGGVVRLDIYEEVSAVVPNPLVDPNIAGPTTTVRSTSTTVVARDGQTVVLGGLISDNVTSAESKIPYIGDVPVFGNLFKSSNDTRNKINLLIFLTPRIIQDEAQLAEASQARRDRFRREMRVHEKGPRRAPQLEASSWELPEPPPILAPTPVVRQPLRTAPPPPPSSARPPAARPTPAPMARVAPPVAPTPARPAPSSPAALGIPESGYRFAVLLSLFEQGTPPPELQTSNGFLTVYVPNDLRFFHKGNNYTYESPRYEAKYTCLEVFEDAREALAVYPDGQALDRWQGAVVRWKPFSAEEVPRIRAGTSRWARGR